MPAYDELIGKIDSVAATLEAFRVDVAAAIAAEGAQVAAAIAALEAQLGNVLTPAEFAALADKIDALKQVAALPGVTAAVEAIYSPAEPPL